MAAPAPRRPGPKPRSRPAAATMTDPPSSSPAPCAGRDEASHEHPQQGRCQALARAAWPKCTPLAVPQLGFYASSGRAWWLWAAFTLRGRRRSTGRPAAASGARASRLQSRRFHRC
eukprot:scaffold38432_cov52-Phaeocystis_antarctica.AAC.1